MQNQDWSGLKMSRVLRNETALWRRLVEREERDWVISVGLCGGFGSEPDGVIGLRWKLGWFLLGKAVTCNFSPPAQPVRVALGLEHFLAKRWRALTACAGLTVLLGDIFLCYQLDVYYFILLKCIHQWPSDMPLAFYISDPMGEDLGFFHHSPEWGVCSHTAHNGCRSDLLAVRFLPSPIEFWPVVLSSLKRFHLIHDLSWKSDFNLLHSVQVLEVTDWCHSN